MQYELTVKGKSTRFRWKSGETFNEALSRAAAKLGYKGGAFKQPNSMVVTVCDRPLKNSNVRLCCNGQYSRA